MEMIGVPIRFDLKVGLNLLSDNQKGQLMEAMIEYVQAGTLPDFCNDDRLLVVWAFAKSWIDEDIEAIQEG